MGRRPTVAKNVANRLTARISTGAYAPGDWLPATRPLAEELDVSRSAVIAGIGILASSGLVEIQKNRGAQVTSEIPHKSGLDRALSVRRTGRIYAPGEYATVDAAMADAPPDVAVGLGLAPGTPVIRRHRVTRNAGGAVESASTSWYDGSLAETAPRLLSNERIPEGSWAYLESRTGRRAVRGTEAIEVRLATGDDADDLGITPPAAVKVATLILRDADDGVVEYGVSVTPRGRRVTYEFDVPE